MDSENSDHPEKDVCNCARSLTGTVPIGSILHRPSVCPHSLSNTVLYIKYRMNTIIYTNIGLKMVFKLLMLSSSLLIKMLTVLYCKKANMLMTTK